MLKHEHGNGEISAPGRVLHWATRYDLLVWLFTFGRERAFREKILRLAHLEPGEAVIDVGCGTGTLAILAKQQVGPAGTVHGIDASPEMIARADQKARKAGVEVAFEKGIAQALPFRDAQFDVVLTTLMLHHLSRESREQLASEIRRVLKPRGRVLAVDFAQASSERASFIDYFHCHGHSVVQDIVAELKEAGLMIVATGAVGTRNLQFVMAAASPEAVSHVAKSADCLVNVPSEMHRDEGKRQKFLVVGIALGIIALIAAHVAAPLWLASLLDFRGSYLLISLLIFLVVLKIGFLGELHRRGRGILGGRGHGSPDSKTDRHRI